VVPPLADPIEGARGMLSGDSLTQALLRERARERELDE
jgi:hypothetical protein